MGRNLGPPISSPFGLHWANSSSIRPITRRGRPILRSIQHSFWLCACKHARVGTHFLDDKTTSDLNIKHDSTMVRIQRNILTAVSGNITTPRKSIPCERAERISPQRTVDGAPRVRPDLFTTASRVVVRLTKIRVWSWLGSFHIAVPFSLRLLCFAFSVGFLAPI